MNDEGYTLAELSVTLTIAVIVFGYAITFVQFAERLVKGSIDQTLVDLDMALLSSRVASDVRNARGVTKIDDGYKIIGQNNSAVTYSRIAGVFHRNAVSLGSTVAIDSLQFVKREGTHGDIVEFTLHAEGRRDSTLGFTSSSGVLVRGAPIWPTVDRHHD